MRRSLRTPSSTLPPETTTDRLAATDADRALVRRMAAGDESALGALHDRWSRLLHSLAFRFLHDGAEAEEVVEEAFWQAWKQAHRYEESRGAVGTWLMTIARSRALDRARARGRTREDALSSLGGLDVESVAPSTEGGSLDPARGAEEGERRGRVAGALAALPPEQRETILLAYFGGLSQTEIATRTGQPLGTVKTRTRLAMERLRHLLGALREEMPWGR